MIHIYEAYNIKQAASVIAVCSFSCFRCVLFNGGNAAKSHIEKYARSFL